VAATLPHPILAPSWSYAWPGIGPALALTLGVAIFVGAVGSARALSAAQDRTDVIQLWILPGDQDGVPVAEIGARGTLRTTETFELRLQIDGQEVQSWPVTLSLNEEWHTTVNLPSSGYGRAVATLSPTNQGDHISRWVALRSVHARR
jgi:hypothetical protein